MKIKIKEENGITLVELLVVIVILGILAAIAVPSVYAYIDNSREGVCYANRMQVGRMYKLELSLNELEHTNARFSQYILEYGDEICPIHGEASYVDGQVECSLHDSHEDQEGEDESGVPIL